MAALSRGGPEMHADTQAQLAFFLTGRRAEAELRPLAGAARPAQLAAYRDLTRLRYDFPLLLAGDASDSAIESLSGLVDAMLEQAGSGGEAERLRAQALRLERELRALTAAGARGTLGEALDAVAPRLPQDAEFAKSLARLRAALPLDAELADCDAALPARLLAHVWDRVQRGKAAAFRERAERLILGLENILRADRAHSAAARSAPALEASFGPPHAAQFDFAAMARVLGSVSTAGTLAPARRARIEAALETLAAQRFFPMPGARSAPHRFAFDDCAAALAAYRARLAEVVALARALAVAALEVAGEYSEARHDALFAAFGESGLDPQELASFPDYLVTLNERDLAAPENAGLGEMLSSGLPVKLLVQTDDLLGEPLAGGAHLALGARSRQLADMAIGANDVYVLQSSASNLYALRARLEAAMRYAGPALVCVYSGSGGEAAGLPPYLVAAAAMDARAYPAFCYDPTAGGDWASRFSLESNAQAEADWPVHALAWEDAGLRRVEERAAFTLADFVACDARHARHFAAVPREKWNGSLVPLAECLGEGHEGLPETLPSLLMVDAEDRLQRVIVDDRLVREARRCRDIWRSLQELGGIHNSHAGRALARRTEQAPAPAPAAQPATPAPPVAAAPQPEAEAPPPDEAYIETARCSSCNECIQLNPKMFAYDENQQARIADRTAGTYRDLVEAAENCQVAVIHPGKPTNADEPGLEELLKRAEPFL